MSGYKIVGDDKYKPTVSKQSVDFYDNDKKGYIVNILIAFHVCVSDVSEAQRLLDERARILAARCSSSASASRRCRCVSRLADPPGEQEWEQAVAGLVA